MQKTLNLNIRELDKGTENILTILLMAIALAVPAFLGEIITAVFGETSFVATHSQLIIGSIVNGCLVLTALKLKGLSRILAVVTMPSVSTVLSGFVFGNGSVYMVYMIPFIWLGNLLFVYMIKYLLLGKEANYGVTVAIASAIKTFAIYTGFSLLKGIVSMPEAVMNSLSMAMSINQLITAIVGSSLVYFIYKNEYKQKQII